MQMFTNKAETENVNYFTVHLVQPTRTFSDLTTCFAALSEMSWIDAVVLNQVFANAVNFNK